MTRSAHTSTDAGTDAARIPQPSLAGASGHNPVLDGIRGLAILLVMWHHLTVMHPASTVDSWYKTATEFGACGVDLFFVLSGFLITGILYDSKQALGRVPQGGRQYFMNFYARRTLRIFPLYYAVVIFALLVLPHIGAALQGFVGPGTAELIQSKLDRFGSVQGYEVWFWAYLSNFPIAYAASWLHTVLGISWSLAIEEQFYLLWPGFVWFLDRKRAIRACLVIVLGALIIRCYMAYRLHGYGYANDTREHFINPIGIYVLTFCRFDDLGLGALAALMLRGTFTVEGAAKFCKPMLMVCLPAAIGLALVDQALGWNDARIGVNFGPLFQSVGFTLAGLACVSGLVLAVAARPGGAWHCFWTCGLMRTLGKYAYALYLFHLPIRAAIRDVAYGPAAEGGGGPRIVFPRVMGTDIPAQLLFYVIGIGAALGAAWVSWVVFESQILKLKKFFPSGVEGKGRTEPRAQRAESAAREVRS